MAAAVPQTAPLVIPRRLQQPAAPQRHGQIKSTAGRPGGNRTPAQEIPLTDEEAAQHQGDFGKF
jgi:hypothetical protein